MGLRNDLEARAWRVGGGTKARQDRAATARDYARWARRNNIQTKNARDIKSRHAEQYVEYLRNERGLSNRTIQNYVGGIRQITREAGGRKMPSNAELDIQSERPPAREAITDQAYEQARACLAERDSHAERAGLGMQRWMGLRAEEITKSTPSLPHWERQLERGDPVHVIHGTKSGKPRWIQPTNREKALEAVREARAALENSGRAHLIKSTTERGAKSRYERELREAGLTGRQSPHSARYRYAQERMAYYRSRGYSEPEARAAASLDLGHGDKRGRWIHSVYGAR